MIKLIKVNKYFDYNTKHENHVLKDITLELPLNGIVSIVGESGSGKTTLLKLLSNKLEFENGNIQYLDNDLSLNSKKNIGYIYQDFALLEQISVYDNMKLQLRALCINDYRRIDSIFLKMNIENLKYRVVSSLSGGEKQKIAIARAILIDPIFIVADEPTGNLDPDSVKMVMRLLSDIAKQKLVILVTHDSKISNKYSSIIYNLNNGYLEKHKDNKGFTKNPLLPNKQIDEIIYPKFNSRINIFKNILHFDKILAALFIIIGILLSLLIGVFLERTSVKPIDFATMPTDYYYVDGTLNDSNSNKISYNDLIDLKSNNVIDNYHVLRNIRDTESYWGLTFKTGVNFNQIVNKEIFLPFNLIEYSENADYGLVYGRLPNENNEIIVDSIIANYIFEETEMGFFMTNYRDIENSNIVLLGENGNDIFILDIVGIVDSGVPCIYSSKAAAVSFDGGSFNMHSYYLYEENIKIEYGRYPTKPYEIIYPYSKEYLGQENEFNSFLINSVNGLDYTVVGLYSDIDTTKTHTISLTTNETLELSYLNIIMEDFSVQLINKEQKNLFENETDITVKNIYNLEKDTYINEEISKIKLLIYSILFSIGIMFFIILLVTQNQFKSIMDDIRVMRILGFSKFKVMYDYYIKNSLNYFIVLILSYSLFTLFCLSLNMLLENVVSFYNFNLFIFSISIIAFWVVEIILYLFMSVVQLRKA